MSLARERLTALLAAPALTSVELVIAPPGYGKTTVLRDYAEGDADAVFVALPEGADLEALVRAVIAAASPAGARSIGALFANPGERHFEERTSEWLVSRLRAFNGTLIVDDFHRANADERAARVLTAVIAATHGRMRWIVASREAPRFPMGSWIARGWMGLPITSEDLRFTTGEAAALAAELGIALAPDELGAIVEDTAGWPIGVRLALGLVARKRTSGGTRMQTRDALFALLDDEVWGQLPAELQRLIAAAALVPAPAISTLIAAGFSDARAAMATVFERVPFIAPVDDDSFTIHDLFREFVLARAPSTASDAAAAARIGAALLGEGSVADGLQLLITAGRASDVLAALATHAFELLETGNRNVVNAALALLAENGLGDDGVSLAIRGALAFSDGSGSNAANLFTRAMKKGLPPAMRCEVPVRLALSYGNRGLLDDALKALEPVLRNSALTADEHFEIEALSLMFRAASGHHQAGKVGDLASALQEQLPNVAANVQVKVLQRLGIAAFYEGDLETAERLSQDAALLATDLGMDTFAALAYGTLYSTASLIDADITRARSFLRSQIAAAERAANTSLRVYALRAQYAIAALNAEFGEAAQIEAQLATLVDARSFREAPLFREAVALQFVSKREYAKAEAALSSLPAATLSETTLARREALLAVLRILRGDRASAGAALERALLTEASLDFRSRIDLAYAYAFRGLAYWGLDRPAQARKAFDIESTALPHRDRVLVDQFGKLVALPHPLPNVAAIEAFCEELQRSGFGAYAELLRRLVERDANDVHLSTTEIETLRVFDQLGGRAIDVAKALGKSKYTVQNQIQSAIRKLGCSGRAEALAYARQRGWLDKTSS
jgi:ATP/maltotriose-dependent transcriptional regulator MalT